MNVRERVTAAFAERFGSEPCFVTRAPGRVNLIGEHTDYNDGFVLPLAIDREVCIAGRPRGDRRVVIHSLEFGDTADFDLTALTRADHTWGEYVKGCAWVLGAAGQPLKGWEGVLSGDVPRGAGLSSSAALELATLRAFTVVADSAWDTTTAALYGRRVENEWIGVNSGIMDQLVVARAQAGHAMLIDCRTYEVEAVPLPDSVAVVVLDTSTRRGLVGSAYNERRQQCENAARILGVVALRDVDSSVLEAGRARMDECTFRRARHVVSENERTLQAAAALRAQDLTALGKLMNNSHASLRDDFEVTNAALNAMTTIAQEQAACYGTRMTGAGFGGCAVALVAAAGSDEFIAEVSGRYNKETGLTARAYACHAADGTSFETLNQGVNS